MSHLMTETEKGPGPWIEKQPDPLANYNSLTDGHLTGYFANARKRKHLRKVGLISRSGHLVSENTYRINTARKEHRKHIKNLLAQAIVEKTLDLERHRQNIIKQKLEEIAKMELVQRVREEEKERPVTKWSSRPNSAIPTSTQKVKLLPRAQSASEKRPNEEDILPFLSPRSPRRPISGPAATKSVGSPKGKYRPISAPQRKRPESGSTKTSTNYDDEDEEDVEYLDISPRRNGENRNDNGVDFKQLYSLNAAALRKYAMTLAKIEQGRGGMSPYNITTQVPLPPKSPRREHNTSARSRRYKDGGLSDRSPTRRTASGQAYLHQMDSITVHPGQLQSMVEVTMRYHGWKLSLARDELDPRNQVIIEQQHCGGNTLTVFKEKLLPKSDFTFVSHRHRGYPFSLTIYVDGRMDSRVSTCCEYRHAKHVRLGGPNGHFSIVSVTGNMPCYKCQVQRGGKKKKKKQPSAQPEDGTEEIILEAHQTPETEVQMQNSVEEGNQEQILVPVENDIVEVKPIEEACENYDDDFEDSDVEKDKKDESKENVEEEEELDNREIRGLSLESPRDSLNDTPVTVLEKDEEVLLNGRKIDAYSSEEEDLDGPVSKVVIVETDEEDQEAVSEDSSSDSDTDSDSDDSSSSDSVSSTSGSDNESEVKKTGDTQTDETKPEVNEQSVENDKKEKDAVNPEESANKEKRSPPKDDTVASTENQNGDTTTTAEEKQVNGKGKTKSVRFRNTPEPMENRVSNGHAETEENDDGEDEEPTVRTFLSKSGVAPNKIHAGSIKHLLDDSNDIQLDGIYLEKHQIEEICDIVKEREDLKTLSLHNAGLKDEDLNKISDALICSPSEPVMLNFMLNELTSKSMEFLVEVMRAEPTLDILLLQGNEIGDEGVRILADGIVDIHLDARQRRKNSLIRQSSELQVVQIHAHQDGSVPQAPPQRRNSSLFDPARNARFCRLGELDLGDTGLTDDGMEHVARMLEQNVYLETLSLSSNIEIGKRGWLRLSKALEKNRRLQTLTLDFNNIGDDGITLLCRGLKDNRTINAIDLEETGIGERGGRMLLELLKRNTTILDMTLTPGNNIPESILNEIKRYLLLNQAADGY
ncbi:glutamate-rich protein 3 isoform X7 [Patella vulgata]|uniref:glutamate-rich protein 3 isoform X7 n=1 Tax=Patella vulgata TaxID=6465 RepID=UPI0024A8E77B|nr:glutamate-rich protein 3 isoform X7 [Patella vulgata]